MQKSTLSLMAAATMMLGACTGESSNFAGTVEGVASDTLMVSVYDMTNRKPLYTDTVPLQNKHFAIQLPDTSVLSIQMYAKPAMVNGKMAALRMSSKGPVIFLPGDQLTVSGDISEPVISGSAIYDQLAKETTLADIEKEMSGLTDEFRELYEDKEANAKAIDSIRTLFKETAQKIVDIKFEIVKAHPDQLVAGYLFTQLSAKKGLEAYDLLADNIKNGPLKPIIEKTKSNCENTIKKEKARENIQPGKPAPEFKLKDLDNKERTLSSFNGKYVLLDFWGTWCGWCIKGMPEMKKYYAKYSSKVEFVGVDCGDTEEKWREGVKKHELPWTNLYNGEANEIITNYAISGYPTKILIDAEGKIIEVFVGESPELYKKLDELFK